MPQNPKNPKSRTRFEGVIYPSAFFSLHPIDNGHKDQTLSPGFSVLVSQQCPRGKVTPAPDHQAHGHSSVQMVATVEGPMDIQFSCFHAASSFFYDTYFSIYSLFYSLFIHTLFSFVLVIILECFIMVCIISI